MTYFNTKAGSVEEAVKGLSKDLNDSAYQDMFKKELEKTGKGIGSMSPKEKKDFFNMIDKKYKAQNEELSAAQKKLPPALQKAIKDKEDKKEELDSKDKPTVKKIITKLKGASQAHAGQAKDLEKAMKTEKVDNPYAVGMAAAMKQTGDKPPLKKSTITKAHDIAKSIEKDDKKEEVKEDKGYTDQQIKMAYGVLNDPRYRQGNYSGAVATIEKIAKGLSNHPDVKNALKRANEEVEVEKLKEDVTKLFETHTFRTKPMNKRQKDTGGEKEIINPVKDETGDVKEDKAKMSEQTAKNFDLYRSIHSVWSNAAEDLEEVKKNAKYMKAQDVAPDNDADEDESEKDKKKTMINSQKTKVDTSPEVEYQK